MDRYIEQNLEEILSRSLDGNKQAEFDRRLESADEYTRHMVAVFRQQGSMIRSSFQVPEQMQDELDPAPGFYARVLQRIESQRVNVWWAAFLEPRFSSRLAFASLALLLLLSFSIFNTDAEPPVTATATPVEILAIPASDGWNETTQAQDRNVILVDLATYRE
ncbi:MAG: hypothetical protein JJE04_04355 [Acidobacteriia bacterium]|nr:hypothetical protein [Terriglobia bacterium]